MGPIVPTDRVSLSGATLALVCLRPLSTWAAEQATESTPTDSLARLKPDLEERFPNPKEADANAQRARAQAPRCQR